MCAVYEEDQALRAVQRVAVIDSKEGKTVPETDGAVSLLDIALLLSGSGIPGIQGVPHTSETEVPFSEFYSSRINRNFLEADLTSDLIIP